MKFLFTKNEKKIWPFFFLVKSSNRWWSTHFYYHLLVNDKKTKVFSKPKMKFKKKLGFPSKQAKNKKPQIKSIYRSSFRILDSDHRSSNNNKFRATMFAILGFFIVKFVCHIPFTHTSILRTRPKKRWIFLLLLLRW